MGVIEDTTLRLTPAHRSYLLRAAREAMEAAVRDDAPPERDEPDPLLIVPCGAFVTLTLAGDLRGCIGYFEPAQPLLDAVTASAVKAALDDHRFPPVLPGELARLRLEISVLSPKVPVGSLAEIVIGRDGLFLESGSARGLLLPQVAIDRRWDAAMFLRETCRKCGLVPAPVGSPGIAVWRFSADVFSEPARGGGDLR